MDMYVVYHVVLNNQVVIDNIIEWNTIEEIEEEWNKKGYGVLLLSTGTN